MLLLCARRACRFPKFTHQTSFRDFVSFIQSRSGLATVLRHRTIFLVTRLGCGWTLTRVDLDPHELLFRAHFNNFAPHTRAEEGVVLLNSGILGPHAIRGVQRLEDARQRHLALVHKRQRSTTDKKKTKQKNAMRRRQAPQLHTNGMELESGGDGGPFKDIMNQDDGASYPRLLAVLQVLQLRVALLRQDQAESPDRCVKVRLVAISEGARGPQCPRASANSRQGKVSWERQMRLQVDGVKDRFRGLVEECELRGGTRGWMRLECGVERRLRQKERCDGRGPELVRDGQQCGRDSGVAETRAR